MKLIESITLASAAAELSFTSIPQTFTDLVVVLHCRSDNTNTPMFVHLNGSSDDRSGILLQGTGSSISSLTISNFFRSNASSRTANTFSYSRIYISNYKQNLDKRFSIETAEENNAASAFMNFSAGNWANTSAITSLSFGGSFNFVSGTIASLYGILKGSDGIVS